MTNQELESVVKTLQNVDGETMEAIIRAVGMEGQMLRQLILTMPMSTVQELVEEKALFEIMDSDELGPCCYGTNCSCEGSIPTDCDEFYDGEDIGPEYDGAGFTYEDRVVNGQYRVIDGSTK